MKKYIRFVLIVIFFMALPCFFTASFFSENNAKVESTDQIEAVVYDAVFQTEQTEQTEQADQTEQTEQTGQTDQTDEAGNVSIPADAKSGDIIETQLVVSYSDDSLKADEHFVSSTGDFYLLAYDTEKEAVAAEAQFEEDEKADDVENPVVMSIMETDSSSYSSSELALMEDVIADTTYDLDPGTSLTTASTYLSYGPEAIFADTFGDDLLTKYTAVENMPEIVVGIVDTGIDSNHSFLSGRIMDYSYTCIDGTDDAEDDNGHGSHVAGIIVDTTLDNVKLNAYKVADSEGNGTDYTIAAGINAAVADGVDVINISMGGEIPSGYDTTVLEEAVADATDAGVLVCVAAGNENADADNYMPASFDGAFTVAAVDSSFVKAYFSNYGDCVDIAAPGVSIISSYFGGGYASMSGTSMATPFVAAAAALLLSYDSTDSVAEIKNLLSSYATDAGTTGWDEEYGYGVLNLSFIESGDCLLSFDANGGSEVSDIVTVHPGNICPTLLTTSRNGYDFLGWYDEDGNLVSAGDTIDDMGRITLTAHWTPNTYLVTLDPNGGSCSSTSMTVTYDGTYSGLPTPTRVGYTFNGWYTSTGNKILTSTTVTITSDITLTARWTLSNYTITVSSGKNGNISPSTSSVSYGSSKTFTITPDSGYHIESVKVDGTDVGTDSTYTFDNVKANHTISATFSEDISFADVTSDAWYYDAVQEAVTLGLFYGTSTTEFSPDLVMSRAMFVTVLYRYDGSPDVSGSLAFTDVPQDYYYDAVLWASQNGIVSGTTATTFTPNAGVSRQQMVVFLYRYCGDYKGDDVSVLADLSGYDDANEISSYAVTAMKWAVAEGYISGTSGTTLSPQTLATRAQVAKFLVNFIDSL